VAIIVHVFFATNQPIDGQEHKDAQIFVKNLKKQPYSKNNIQYHYTYQVLYEFYYFLSVRSDFFYFTGTIPETTTGIVTSSVRVPCFKTLPSIII